MKTFKKTQTLNPCEQAIEAKRFIAKLDTIKNKAQNSLDSTQKYTVLNSEMSKEHAIKTCNELIEANTGIVDGIDEELVKQYSLKEINVMLAKAHRKKVRVKKGKKSSLTVKKYSRKEIEDTRCRIYVEFYKDQVEQQNKLRQKRAERLVVGSVVAGFGVMAPAFLMGAAIIWQAAKMCEPLQIRQQNFEPLSGNDQLPEGAFEYNYNSKPKPLLVNLEEIQERTLIMDRKSAWRYDLNRFKTRFFKRFDNDKRPPKKIVKRKGCRGFFVSPVKEPRKPAGPFTTRLRA